MAVRNASLEHWFTVHIQQYVWGKHTHIPCFLDLDVTVYAEHFKSLGKPVPYTALMIKAVAMMAEKYPAVNRMVFQTFYGLRILELDTIQVSLPIFYKTDRGLHMKQLRIMNPHDKDLKAIRGEIRKAKRSETPPKVLATPFGIITLASKANFFTKGILRIFFFLMTQFPALYEKVGGVGLAVSSIREFTGPGFSPVMPAYGPMALTFCISSEYQDRDGRTFLRIGAGWDHNSALAMDVLEAVKYLVRLMQGQDSDGRARLLQESKG